MEITEVEYIDIMKTIEKMKNMKILVGEQEVGYTNFGEAIGMWSPWRLQLVGGIAFGLWGGHASVEYRKVPVGGMTSGSAIYLMGAM